LRRALELAGTPCLPDEAAHHIVAQNREIAKPSVVILQRFGIGVHDADNGVCLPRDEAAAKVLGSSAAPHETLHTNEYYNAVNNEFRDVKSREEALEKLNGIRQELLRGRYP
jgi:hypothetical protein